MLHEHDWIFSQLLTKNLLMHMYLRFCTTFQKHQTYKYHFNLIHHQQIKQIYFTFGIILIYLHFIAFVEKGTHSVKLTTQISLKCINVAGHYLTLICCHKIINWSMMKYLKLFPNESQMFQSSMTFTLLEYAIIFL